MKIKVERLGFLEKSTIGKLSIDGVDAGIYTLEDKVRQIENQAVSAWKVPGETAIPRGTYKVIVDFSNHFQKDLPHILDVRGFEGVRIHPGNTDADTEGCILVGKSWSGGDFIGESKVAFDELFEKIKSASEVEIEVC